MARYPYLAKLAGQQEKFGETMRGLAAELRGGTLTLEQWYYRSQVAIQGHILDGYRLGIAQARGIAPSKVRLTATERLAANQEIVKQFEYLAKFREAIRARLAAGKELTSLVDARAALYAGGERSVFGFAQLSQDALRVLTWHRHAMDSCVTCLGNAGQTRTAIEWKESGIWPAHGTVCNGNCRCTLS